MRSGVLARITEPEFALAEGPVWDDRAGRLHWVDLIRGSEHRARFADAGETSLVERASLVVDSSLGAVALTDRPGALVAVGTRTVILIEGSSTPRMLAEVLPPNGPHRLNDAGVDPGGRLLLGSASSDGLHRGNSLWSWSPDEGLRVIRDDIALSNGLDFSPDGGALFHVDSRRHRIDRADYDVATGTAGEWRTIADFPPHIQPDGLTVDADGCVWVALWGGGCVQRRSAEGRLLETIEIPAPKVSSVAFAGDDLGTLVVTTASAGMSPEERRRWPGAGALFATRPGARGLAPRRVRLASTDPGHPGG